MIAPDRRTAGATKSAPGAQGSAPAAARVVTAERAPLPAKRRERRRSSVARESEMTELKALPLLKDTPPEQREQLFLAKLQICSIVFNFDDPESNLKGKEIKRMTLLELVDFVNSVPEQKAYLANEALMKPLMDMIKANIFRTLPPSGDDFDPEEDEPALEPAWPHLQVVYELLLRYTVCPHIKSKVAKRHITQKVCLQLVELFDAEDPRERDYLKTVLHRIYGKVMSLRSFIRRAMANVFFRYVYETQRHNGVGELLEILGSIINGFAKPLKAEHVVFLERALIPLHRPVGVTAYHQQLSYCVTQYVEKDPTMVAAIVLGMIKSWPWANSGKQVMFLNELEEILELVPHEAMDKVFKPLFRVVGKCLGSQHFQVAERCLFLWNSDTLLASGVLCRACAPRFLPIIWADLDRAATAHWNPTVSSLAQNVIKHYQDTDPDLARACAKGAVEAEAARKAERVERDRRWEELEAMVAQAAVDAGVKDLEDDTAAGAARAMAVAVASGGKSEAAPKMSGTSGAAAVAAESKSAGKQPRAPSKRS
ncbi:hypothetical protein FNF29_01498 [Cafeteria roenbergensis]|uniref:Serine/threonine protein phosphatase 2A regulatory subunit n=1 Tax=Cafeteria roenbergensis TaxID=33653 RepID=A0A5A8CUV6_CAFRO|nr:hypothetical protein FNF29_01498 [Cafeteria roenbergensis]|eukprot:KAA0155581.1 hypothetical protein FNF29_01498 [Cafeteria roenbergensis]